MATKKKTTTAKRPTRKAATATTKTRRAKQVEMENAPYAEKKEAFLAALVKEFGEGTVITRKQLLEAHAKNPDAYPHPAVVRKDLDYRVARGRYVVTASDKPAKERDKARKAWEKAEKAKEAKRLPADTRKSAAKLAKAVKGANDAPRRGRPKKAANA